MDTRKILEKVKKIYELSSSILDDFGKVAKIERKGKKTKAHGIKRWKKRGITNKLNNLISGNFFDQPKTINDVKNKLHQLGLIVKSTDLSAPLLKLIKKEVLDRDKKVINKKELWVYKKK
jgi:hypothetical protein